MNRHVMRRIVDQAGIDARLERILIELRVCTMDLDSIRRRWLP